MYSWREFAREALQPIGPERDERVAGGQRVAAQAGDVDVMADRGEGGQQSDAVVELHRRSVEVSVFEQMVHAHADLEDALVEIAKLAWGRSPQQLQRFVLLEELARVELVDRLQQLRWGRFRAPEVEIGALEAFQGGCQFRVG